MGQNKLQSLLQYVSILQGLLDGGVKVQSVDFTVSHHCVEMISQSKFS